MQKILIPLDGSNLAEASLSVARTIGSVFDSEITLITVASVGVHDTRPDPVFSGGLGFKEEGEYKLYLEHIASNLSNNGISAKTMVVDGPVVEAIGNRVGNGQDLIIMSTNGRSGIKRLMMGSVASRVVQTSSTPILLLKPTDGWRSRGTDFRQLLVALDGSPHSERVLPYVSLFAQSFASKVTLLTVPVGNASAAYQAQLGHYLQGVAEELLAEGVQVEVMVTGNGPARTIVRISHEHKADLIMLATQGRGGFDRLMLGSVADRIIQTMPCPLFLVPSIHE
jgi:nucleotide-binding universal stress UspA family protein